MSKWFRVVGVFLAMILAIAGLTACGSSNGVNEDLLVTANVQALTCSATTVNELQAAADFVANTTERQQQDILALSDSNSDIASLTAALEAKIAECTEATPSDTPTEEPTSDPNAPLNPGNGAEQIGVLEHDSSTAQLPVVNIGESADVAIFTQVPETQVPSVLPVLLDRSSRVDNTGNGGADRALSWQELVELTAGQQFYQDGINSFAGGLGFDWNDVQKFAAVNTHGADRCDVQYNSIVIQVFAKANITDDQIRAVNAERVEQVECSTPEGKEKLRQVIANAPIRRIDGGFVNTWNDGTLAQPHMGKFWDTSSMIRWNLAPISFDAAGNPVGLDGSREAGIFTDCLNPHWVPVAVWTCASDGSCGVPPCPPGMVGSQPNCSWPPTNTPVCPWNPALPPDDPDCVAPKDISEAPQRTGKLPEQQKPNPLPAQPALEQPAQPTLPPEVYTSPAPQPPAPAASRPPSNPAPLPTPDPAPAPSKEPEAPAPSAPVTGCIPIPDVEDCS